MLGSITRIQSALIFILDVFLFSYCRSKIFELCHITILSLFRKELISVWISEYNIQPPAWISCAEIRTIHGILYFSMFQ
jgi:hypothetical protein